MAGMTKQADRSRWRRLLPQLWVGVCGLLAVGGWGGEAAGQEKSIPVTRLERLPEVPARRPATGFGLPVNTPSMVLSQTASNDPLALRRREMVSEQIRMRGVDQESVLKAMEIVPRHLFVPTELRSQAYDDQPLDIGWGYTIYQPYMVARMTELLDLKGDEKVLEIGTGSGYHSAILSRVAREVCSMEINGTLAGDARRTLRNLGFTNVDVRVGDGYQGWPEEAPFDAIILTAAPRHIPDPLIQQLRVGGRMVIPLGGELQNLLVVTKTTDGIERRTVAPVRVPLMEGEARNRR